MDRMEKTYNVFWNRNGSWSKVNNTPMIFDDADALVRTCETAQIQSVTGIELTEVGTEPAAWHQV